MAGSDLSSERDWPLSDPMLPSPYAKVAAKEEVGASDLDPEFERNPRALPAVGTVSHPEGQGRHFSPLRANEG